MKLVNLAVARPVTIWMFTLGIMLFGLVAMARLAVNLLPDLSYPTLTIRTDYLGAAPAEVEQLVSKPIEESVGIVKGIRKVQSVSRSGRSDVIMEFEWGTDMDLAGLEVREKLDVLWLPLDVKKPLLLRFNPNLDPIVRLALSRNEGNVAKNDSENSATAAQPAAAAVLTPAVLSQSQQVALRTYADEELRRKLEALTGVAAVRPDGGLTQEIQVLVDNEKLSQLNLDISAVNTRLKAQNINQAGGRLETAANDYLVRTINQFNTLDEMRNLYIATVNGSHVRLSDIAQVKDAFVDRQSITYVDGREAIEIAIYKEGDANTVQVAQTVIAKLEELQKTLPAGYELKLVYDQSTFISDAISEVKSAAISGGVLAMLVLYLFLRNLWTTLVISISIPLSIIATFNLMYAQEISLNIMSLGGIALAIGMLVDNAIVVLENISRYKEQGYSAMEAAKKGASEVSMAITASTLTTVAVFFPLVFIDGIAGQLFKDQALTVTYALLASLVVALTLIPAMAAHERSFGGTKVAADEVKKVRPQRWYQWVVWVLKLPFVAVSYLVSMLISLLTLIWRGLAKICGLLFNPLLDLVQSGLRQLEQSYRWVLQKSLQAKSLVLVITLAITGVCFSLAPRLGFDVIPAMSQGEFYVEVQLPVGSAIERTDLVLKQLAQVAKAQD
ncbi:MAG: efflux RND transporter permease subunit, partial [Rheinheimera sp.]